jgi:uncharacterized membrane protein YcaP (DUF421 family)
MFSAGTPLLQIALRTLVVYLAILVGFRLMGKRELGQMNVFDLVVILLIANAVQNAMVGPDASLQGGLIAAGVLLVLNRAVAMLPFLHRSGRFWGRLLEGTPTILVKDGTFLRPALGRELVLEDEVTMAMREHGIEDLAEVQLAVLEIDGSISIVPKEAKILHTRRRTRRRVRP